MNKKGVSIMIGYVLLVTAAVVMGAIIYQWMITYVPSEGESCPDDVSVFLKNYSCEIGTHNQLNVTLKNNGKFNVAGFFIYGSNDSSREIASTDLASYVTVGGSSAGSAILFVARSDNSLEPNGEKIVLFDLTGSGLNDLKFIEIIPMRYQEMNNRLEFVTCGGAKIKESISCNLDGSQIVSK